MKIRLCYFNEHWNIYLYDENNPISKMTEEKQVLDVGDGILRLTKYDHPETPIYSFGYLTHNLKERPGHGGEWSSNTMAINKFFKTNLRQVAYNQVSMAISLDWLKEKLGDKVKWTPDLIYGGKITNIIGEENIYNKWVTLD